MLLFLYLIVLSFIFVVLIIIVQIQVGFTFKLLSAFLHQAGFCKIERVSSFNLFADTSELTVKNYFISLNVAAKVCPDQYQGARFGNKGLKPDDGFNVDHQATPYDGR